MMKKQRHFFRQSILAVLFGFSIHAYADFTLSGTTITQTGTDTNLSGLSGITGVTVNVIGSITYYNIGNYSLVYNDLQINTGSECLVMGSGHANRAFRPASASSRLQLGSETLINGERLIRSAPVIINTKQPTTLAHVFRPDVSSIFLNQGTLEWWDGTIENNRGLILGNITGTAGTTAGDFNAGSFIKQGAVASVYPVIPPYTANPPQIFINSTTLHVDGLTVRGAQIGSQALAPIYAPRVIPNIPPRLIMEGSSGISDHLPNNALFNTYKDYSSVANSRDLNLFIGYKVRAINTAQGSATIIVEHNITASQAAGLVEIRKEWEATLTDVYGNPIEGAVYYIRDTNNGDRRNAFGETYTNDFIYTNTTDASGKTGVVDVLTAVVAKSAAVLVRLDDVGQNKKDRRSKNNNTEDEFDIYFYSYNESPSNTTRKLKGVGVLEFEWTLVPDVFITEPNQATVAAYTEINTLDMLYDRAKSWKLANIEEPTIDTQLITGDGNSLDLGAFDLVVDATASSAFAIDTTNEIITIKSADLLSGDKFTTITTTGTISTANGALVDFGYIDSTGTNKYVRLNNLMNWDVNVIDNSDPTAPTDILAETGVTGDYRKHFIYNGETEIVVELTFANVVFFSETFPQPDLDFIRSDFIVKATEENQERMLYLLERILLNEEGISETLRATTPNGTINVTNTTTDSEATLENQVEIVKFLERIMLKTSTTREVLKQEE